MRKQTICILSITLITVFTLTACGGSDDSESSANDDADTSQTVVDENNTNADTPETNQTDTDEAVSFDDMEAGTHEFSISGAFTSDGTYSGEEEVSVSYEPFNSPNMGGQHELEIFADVSPSEFSEGTIIEAYIRFPADIEVGSYDINTRDSNAPDIVQAFTSFDSFASTDFDENISGTLDIIEIGEQITASFNFTADGDVNTDTVPTIEVSGRVNQLLFSYRPDASFTLSGVVDREYTATMAFEDDTQTYVTQYFIDEYSNEFRWDVVYREAQFQYMAQTIFYLTSDIAPGTYEIIYAPSGNQHIPEGSQVSARLSYAEEGAGIDFNADTITGTITIEIDERNYVSNTFEIVGVDSDTGETLTAIGTFQYYENQFGQPSE